MTGPHHKNFENAPCPCESGRLSKNCCLASDDTFRPKRCTISMSESTTGYSHPNCYASPLNDCSHDISREHYISRGVLKLMSQNNKLGASGFHWLPTGHNFASPDAFTARILCRRHNNALASIDNIAARLYRDWASVLFDFGAIEQFRKPDRNSWWWDYSKRSKDHLFLFNGHDIEQWLLKLLCGLVFSGNSSINGQRLTDWRPDEKWLRILFGKDPFPVGWGLHFSNSINERLVADYRLSLSLIINNNGISGLKCLINNVEFILAMMQPDTYGKITLHDSKDIEQTKVTTIYRPKQLNLHDGDRNRVFEFYWDPPGDGKSLHIKFDKKQTTNDYIIAQGYPPSQNTFNTTQQLRRNGPCPCGSRLKYKLCCGRKK
jgi:hypothetical protein